MDPEATAFLIIAGWIFGVQILAFVVYVMTQWGRSIGRNPNVRRRAKTFYCLVGGGGAVPSLAILFLIPEKFLACIVGLSLWLATSSAVMLGMYGAIKMEEALEAKERERRANSWLMEWERERLVRENDYVAPDSID